ncbi:unnamed protein product [Victoria cruziana]
MEGRTRTGRTGRKQSPEVVNRGMKLGVYEAAGTVGNPLPRVRTVAKRAPPESLPVGRKWWVNRRWKSPENSGTEAASGFGFPSVGRRLVLGCRGCLLVLGCCSTAAREGFYRCDTTLAGAPVGSFAVPQERVKARDGGDYFVLRPATAVCGVPSVGRRRWEEEEESGVGERKGSREYPWRLLG